MRHTRIRLASGESSSQAGRSRKHPQAAAGRRRMVGDAEQERPADDRGEVHATASSTLMSPRVAREYGQVWCAISTNLRLVSSSTPGMLTLSFTASW